MGIITYGCMCPYKDPNDPRKKESSRKALKKYYYKHHERVLANKLACDKKYRDRRTVAMREYRKNNPEIISKIDHNRWLKPERQDKMREYRAASIIRRETQVYTIIPNRCYYESENCLGPLEWDHKYGDGKKDRTIIGNRLNRFSRAACILNNPDRWMRLCRRHNGMKDNIPKDIFESMILEMAEKIKREVSTQPTNNRVDHNIQEYCPNTAHEMLDTQVQV